jgi:hypothetical protein
MPCHSRLTDRVPSRRRSPGEAGILSSCRPAKRRRNANAGANWRRYGGATEWRFPASGFLSAADQRVVRTDLRAMRTAGVRANFMQVRRAVAGLDPRDILTPGPKITSSRPRRRPCEAL